MILSFDFNVLLSLANTTPWFLTISFDCGPRIFTSILVWSMSYYTRHGIQLDQLTLLVTHYARYVFILFFFFINLGFQLLSLLSEMYVYKYIHLMLTTRYL